MSVFNLQSKTIVHIFIILLAVSPAFALGDGNRNLLLIGAMGFSPFFLIRYPVIIPKLDFPLILLCFGMIAFPIVFHPETMRWSTVLYSCMFCLYFMAFVRVLRHSDYALEDLSKLLKGLLYAYCIVLIIQQFCVLIGLPIFNISNYSIKEPWKLNSLMSEPSHSARIIPVLMYMYICTQFRLKKIYTLRDSLKVDRNVWFAFLWPVLTMGSATAFLFMLIVFAKFINIKRFLPSLIMIASVASFFILFSENKAVDRMKKTFAATLTLDEKTIIHTDHSASFRIVPTIQGAKFIGLTTLNDFIGHGVDADQQLITPLPSVKIGNSGAFYMWVNFGCIVALLFWIFTLKICFNKKDLVTLFIWLLCVFMYGGINMQIIWLVLALFYTEREMINNLIEE